jgi:hypothetical protein
MLSEVIHVLRAVPIGVLSLLIAAAGVDLEERRELASRRLAPD